MTDFDLTLNPNLNPEALAKTYAKQNNFLRIANLWTPDCAEKILETLHKSTPWKLIHSDDTGAAKTYTKAKFAELSAAEQNRTFLDVQMQARNGFAYIYTGFPMISAYLSGELPEWPLHRLTEFLNSPTFHHFVKTITSETDVTKIDGQATNYGVGHFLNAHNDTGNNAERAVAYVMGFTKNWPTDWGGQLVFCDDDGDILDGYTPTFNSLTLFKVPRMHSVTQVSTFAGASRYSITGWLRTD